jgi:hypothetical protein
MRKQMSCAVHLVSTENEAELRKLPANLLYVPHSLKKLRLLLSSLRQKQIPATLPVRF